MFSGKQLYPKYWNNELVYFNQLKKKETFKAAEKTSR